MFSKWFKREEKKEFERRRTGKDQSCQHENTETRKRRRRPVRPENCLRGARGANGTPGDFIILGTPSARQEVGLLRSIMKGLASIFGSTNEQAN